MDQTEKDYDILAQDYTRTRSFIPDNIRGLADYVLEGEKVLDSGCASGRFFEVLKDKKIDYFGIDISKELIEIAKKRYPQANFQVTDALNLPFPDNFFDKVFSISVIHHIPSKELRIRYLKEIERVLKPEGLLVLRVWDFWRRKEGRKLILKYFILKLIGKSKLDFFDVFVSWKNSQKEVIAQRYFHCFTKKSLIGLAKKSGFSLEKLWQDGKDPRTNIYIIAKKQPL